MSNSARSDRRQSELKCPRCQNWFDEGTRTPKQLQCQHNVCASCVMHLLGESVQGQAPYVETYLQQNRSLSCPVCFTVVRTDGICTNRQLADKISALTGLEALIYTDEPLTSSSRQQVKPHPSSASGQPNAPQLQQPEYQAQAPPFQQPTTLPQTPGFQQSNSQPLAPGFQQPNPQPQVPPFHQPEYQPQAPGFQQQPSSQPQTSPFQQQDFTPQAPPFQHQEYQPQLEATGLGWAVPTEAPRPDMPQTQPGADQLHLGWALPGAPQHGVLGSPDSHQLSTLPPQQMPHPHGIPFTYPNGGPQF